MRIFILLTAVLLTRLTGGDSLGAENGGQSEAPGAPPPNELANSVQSALGINSIGIDVAAHVGRVIKDMSDSSVSALVDELLRGADPNSLYNIVVSNTHVDGVKTDPDGKIGSFRDRTKLALYLWEHAQALHLKADPAAARYAKAALLLPADEGFLFGPYNVLFIGEQKQYADVAGLSDQERAALSSLLETIRTSKDLSFPVDVAEENDWLLMQTGTGLPVDHVKALIDKMDRWRKSVDKSLGGRYLVINQAWRLKNLAQSRKSAEAGRMVGEFVKAWREQCTDPVTLRWIDESIVMQAPEASPIIVRVPRPYE
jgi:hypothetical protein